MTFHLGWRFVPVLALLGLVAVVGGGSPAYATFAGNNGSIAYVAAEATGPGVDLLLADEGGGNPRELFDAAGIYETWGPSFSPGGGTVAFGLQNTFAPSLVFIDLVDTAGAAAGGCGTDHPDNADVCRIKTLASFPPMAGGDTNRPNYRQGPTWSPNGSQVAVASPAGIWVIDVIEASECTTIPCQEGARTLVLANTGSVTYDMPAWEPNGSRIAVRTREVGVGVYGLQYDIGTFPASGGAVTRLKVWREPDSQVDNGCRPGMPSWSPDSFDIAYETGDCQRPVTATLVLPPFGPITYQQIPASSIAVVEPGGPWHRITPITESNHFSFRGQQDPVWAPDKSRLLYYGDCYEGTSPRTGICALSLDGASREYWGELGQFPDWSTGDGSLPNAAFSAGGVQVGLLTGVQRGEAISYDGHGWDPGGPPIHIKWGSHEVATVSPASAMFTGNFEALDFPEFDSRQASLGQTPCREDITADQGGIHRRVHVAGDPGELVFYSTNVYRSDGQSLSTGQSISCKGGVFQTQQDVPLTLGPIGDNVCDDPDITSQFALVTSSISGRALENATDQVGAYPGLWVQMIGPGACIDANGIFADQVWIGSKLVAAGHALGDNASPLETIDLAASSYTRREPAGGIAVNAHIVHFLLPNPPPNDQNQNGIDDDIEPEVEGWNRLFNDGHVGGNTIGKFLLDGLLIYTVLKDSQARGIDITAEGSPFDVTTGEENAGELEVCGTKVRMTAGDHAVFKCDSLSSIVTTGGVEVLMGVNTGAVLPEGTDTTISHQAGDTYKLENKAASGTVQLLAGGALTPVAAGGSAQATVIALKGDVDCGGRLEMLDVIELIRLIGGLAAQPSNPCPASAAAQRDIDCVEGAVAKDALLIAKFVAGVPVTLQGGCAPIGQLPPT